MQKKDDPGVRKTEQLNLDKDGSKLKRLTTAIDDDSRRSSHNTLQQNEELLTGKKAADLISQYAETYKCHGTGKRTPRKPIRTILIRLGNL